MKFKVFYRKRFSVSIFDVPVEVSREEYRAVCVVDAGNADDVFRLMNVIDGDEMPVTLNDRSMSVGDVIVELKDDGSDGPSFFCASIGWAPVVFK